MANNNNKLYNAQMREGMQFIISLLERYEDVYHYVWEVENDGKDIGVWDRDFGTFCATKIIEAAEMMGLSCYITTEKHRGEEYDKYYPVVRIFITMLKEEEEN